MESINNILLKYTNTNKNKSATWGTSKMNGKVGILGVCVCVCAYIEVIYEICWKMFLCLFLFFCIAIGVAVHWSWSLLLSVDLTLEGKKVKKKKKKI